MLELAIKILGIMMPSILLAGIGVLWHRTGTEYPREFVTTLVLNLALPALVFYTLTTTTVAPDALATMGLAALTVQLVMLSTSALILKAAGHNPRLCITFTIGNTGNLGLPLCMLAFGDVGLAYAITFFTIQSIFLFTVGDAIYAGNINVQRMAKVPVIWAVAAALLTRFLDIPVPEILLNTTRILGQLVVPIMLITLGIAIASMQSGNLATNLKWSAIRTALAIAVGFGIAELFNLEGIARGVLVIESVVPVAVFNYLLAFRNNMESSEISGLILMTHLGALLYLPVVLAFLV